MWIGFPICQKLTPTSKTSVESGEILIACVRRNRHSFVRPANQKATLSLEIRVIGLCPLRDQARSRPAKRRIG